MDTEKLLSLFILLLVLVILFNFSSANASEWGSIFIDHQFPGFTSSAGRYSSIAVDSSGHVHIIYYDDLGDLKYATNISGAWITSTVDSEGKVGSYCSIAIDSHKNVHISYYDVTNWDLKHATNNSGEWIKTTVDSEGNVGQYSSIAIDSFDNIHISYLDFTNENLKYAVKNNGSWNITTLDDNGVTGYSTSIAIDSLNNIHISYIEDKSNHSAPPYVYNLKYITNKSGDWTTVPIYTPSEGAIYAYEMDYAIHSINTSITVDKLNFAHIAHHELINNNLMYATNNSGAWTITTIDDSGAVGLNPSICVDSHDNGHISYHDATNGILKYISNSAGSWKSDTVDSTILSGVYSSISLDSSEAVHISYAYSENKSCFDCGGSHFLKYANNTAYPHQIEEGTWFYSTTGNLVSGHSNCLPEANESGMVTLEREGKNITVIFEGDIEFRGMIDTDTCNLASSFSEYPLPDRILPEPNVTYLSNGLMTVYISLIVASSTSASGTIAWSWFFDQNLSCNGESNIILSKNGDLSLGDRTGGGGGGSCFIGIAAESLGLY